MVRSLRRLGLRVKADMRNESLNKRIRDNQKLYTPYMLVVGEREMEEGTVSIRRRDNKQLRTPLQIADFGDRLMEEVASRDLELTIEDE